MFTSLHNKNFKVQKRISFFDIGSSFINLTLFLVISLSVIVFFQNVESQFDILMLNFLGLRKVNSNSYNNNNVLNNIINVVSTKRFYTNPVDMDKVFKSKGFNTLNLWTKQAMTDSLIDPASGNKINVHELDLLASQSIKKNAVKIAELTGNFGIEKFFKVYNKFKLATTGNFQKAIINSKAVYHQRANTISEIACTKVVTKNIPVYSKIEMTWGKPPLNMIAKNLTGNTLPDYACSIVLYNGRLHEFYADLKQTTLASFENKVKNIFPNKNAIISTNIFWIKDVGSEHVFTGITKIRLEDTVRGVIQYYHAIDPKLAKQLYVNSALAFKKFEKTGKLVDYNSIPINSPKFIITEWVKSFF